VDTLHTVIAGIYAAAVTTPLGEFKQAALRHIMAVLPFDTAVWASGVLSSNTMLTVTLLDQPDDMLAEYITKWQALDNCRDNAVVSPGTAWCNAMLEGVEAFRSSAMYLEFCRPYGIEDVLTIVEPRPELDMAEVVCLFRSAPEAVFGSTECATLEQLAPHLAAAWGHAQITHHYRAGALGGVITVGEPQSYAVVGAEGQLRAAGNRFLAAVHQAEPNWRGPALPAWMLALVEGTVESLRRGELEFYRHEIAGTILLSMRSGFTGLRLTAAETRAVRLLVEGATQKQVAQRLGISPSTVRNQLASVYDKLGCHSKIELLQALRDRGFA
jgi:DNA-binding CsgD family transcriptional regulator